MATKKKWKKRPGGGDFWDPKEGDELIGKLEAIRQGNFARDIYDMRVDGKIVTIPSSSVLANQITNEDLDKEIRVVFTGWGQGKGGKYRKFEVFDVEKTSN